MLRFILCASAFLIIKSLGQNNCQVGEVYNIALRRTNNIGGKWYLNTAIPATCSGSISSYSIKYHDYRDLDEDSYDIRVAVWKPVNNSTVWQIDANSVEYRSYTNLGDDFGLITKVIDFSSIKGIRRGSIIGVYLDTSNPLTVIGQPILLIPPSEPYGACVMQGNQTISLINCTSDIFDSDAILHAESNITVVDCGTPHHPNTSIALADGDTQFGARAQYTCDIGYNITSGNNIISCQLNGTWTNPTCQLVDCGSPGSPSNGQLNGDIFTYGASVHVDCNTGYNLIGNDTLSCQANGQWNASTPDCVPVNCGNPGTLPNGTIDGTVYTYPSIITFSCNIGYNLMGNVSLFCQANGQWNASIPVCSLMNCGYPGNVTNGVMMGANYTYSSIVTFTCNEGYILQGTNSLMCLINGWNDTLPSCSPVDCGDPGTPINVRSEGTDYTYQSIITFSCVNDDYTFIGNTAITCNADGHWNGSLPSCVYGDCSDPGIPDNGQRIGSNFSYGASVSFSCNTGYELMGSSSILTCEVGNKWDYDLPVCNIIYCNAPGAPANGSISPSQANFTFNSTVQYQCNIGYEVIGHDTTTCGPDRSWTNGAPVCNMIVCPALTLPNGNIEGSNSYSSTIIFHCNDSYQLSGNSSAVCQLDKTWSTDIPNCLKLCANDSLPSPPINGYQSPITGPYVLGNIVRYHCNAGYALQGMSMVTCLANGHWSPIQEMPQCFFSTLSTTVTSSLTPLTSSQSFSQSSSRTASLITPSNTMRFSPSAATLTSSPAPHSSVVVPSNTSVIPSDTSGSPPIAGPVAGAIAAIIIIIIVIVITVILIALLVTRSKRQKLVINKGHSTNTSVTNPMMHIDGLYDSIPNRQPSVVNATRVHGTGDNTAIPTIIITKETLPNEATLSVPKVITSSTSDYEVPIQTLTRAPPSADYSPGSIYLQLENLEGNDELRRSSGSIYDESLQFPADDDKSTLRRDQATNSIYDDSSELDEKEILRRQLEDNYDNMDNNDDERNNGDTLKRNKVYVEDEYDCIDVLDDLSLPPPINLDESSAAIGLTSEESAALQQDNNGIPNTFYFTLEDPNERQNGQKIETIKPVAKPLITQQKRTLKSTENRKTKVFIQPAENEEEIYGQMETSSVTLISPKTLKIEGSIGSGQFGNVFKALWSKGNDRTIEVAVKTLHKNATEQEKIKFLQEAAIMGQFKHSNVIKLFGIISHKETPMIVIEYMPKGDLFGVLQKLRPDPGQLAHPDIRFNLLSFCRQVCLGMVYLSDKGFVHRDLAARNILVSADNICKIIDFGLSRDLEDENYYVSHKGAMIPVKWTAPEALNYRKYSTASDVWSYGCLMYEIWSVGHKPFEKFSNIDTLERICGGYRLPPPPGCSIAIYKLMMDCWHPIGDDRPSFNDIMLILLQQDKDIFHIPEDALSTHPKSGTLGAPLDAGELMYADIQKTYEGEMDTIL